jgi:type IV pilus assembly protein PilM
MVVDIGSNNTSISVFDHGVPVFNRGIDTAAEHIKKKIGEVLQISQEEAEQVKRDLAHYTIALKGKPKIPQTLKIALSPIINEISYIINLFKNKASNFTLSERNISVEKIILTGGGAWMPYFMRYLSDLLNVKVYIGDPWARISYPEDLDFILEEAGPRLAISVGLALSKL